MPKEPARGSAEEGDVETRVATIRTRIESACLRSRRAGGAVRLVAASKQQPASRLLAAHRAGIRLFGENRVQEGEQKRPLLPDDCEWHLIGPLQSNKVRRAVDCFDFFQAIDRLKIAQALDREAARVGRVLPCLLEINIGEEENKHGFHAADRQGLHAACSLPGIDVRGLMAIPPIAENPLQARAWFHGLFTLRSELRGELGERIGEELSMGMSDDFELAIEEGATIVRVGSALFGRRDN